MANIVIVGAGYAGMMAAARLDRISEPFTIVNKNQYHYFTTLLHEAAGGRGTPMDYTVGVADVVHKPTSKLEVAEVTGINREAKTVATTRGDIAYDYLIVTLGWVPEYFGISGLDKNSMVLDSLEAAKSIRSHIESQFSSYAEDHDPERLCIVIGGAGLTGVELAGEILDWIPKLCIKYGIDQSHVDLQNIEAMPSILPQVSESLRQTAADMMKRKGANLRTNTKIVKVEPDEVHLEGDEIVRSKTIIWTGGVRANPILTEAGFTVDRRGRAMVHKTLQSVDDVAIFIGGDTACCEGDDGKPLPPTAQVAMQMGVLLAENVSSLVHGQAQKTFHAHLKGTLASIGREVGVGDMFGIPVKGVIAGLAKEATKVKYLWDLGGFRLTAEKTGQIVHRS